MPKAIKTTVVGLARSLTTTRRAALEPVRHPVPTATTQLGPTEGVLDLLTGELARARRHERAFSLLHISRAGTLNGSTEHSAGVIRSTLRECDQIQTDESGIAILLTETGAVGAAICVERVAATIGIAPSSVRRASFPDDGVTSGALRAVLEGRLDGLPDRSDLPAGRMPDVVASPSN